MRVFVSALLCSAGILASFSPISRADELSPEPVATENSPAVPELSPGVAEVVKMLDARTATDVIMAYINESTQHFDLTAEQIIYLRDIGVSSDLINAMLRRDVSLGPTTAAETNAPALTTED